MIVYVIQNIGGNENYPDSINIRVNYHYNGEKRVITSQSPSMGASGRGSLGLIVVCVGVMASQKIAVSCERASSFLL